MSKVIKITESDLRRIISEKLEGDVKEDGFLSMLAKKAASAVKPRGFSTSTKTAVKSGYNTVVSTMRREVAQLLAKTPTIKITPKTIKALEEPRYNARVAFDLVDDVARDGGSIRGGYSSIHWHLEDITKELSKPSGQQLNIKKLMEDLYHVKDEISQDLFKRQSSPQYIKELTAPLNRVNAAINHIETLFKTPDKPTSYLVKEEPKL